MAGYVSGDSVSHHAAVHESNAHDRISQDSPSDEGLSRWYLSRKEIEENSTSRRDGIDIKKETYFRKSYCTFLQDLGMRLKVPQVTIATAIIFCHRFFLRQSHSKNDRRTIATVCMFLAGKVEETPRPLKDVIMVSYEIIHKKDLVTAQKIKQKEVYEQQKELILMGERVVLATLAFDLNVHHPYKPLVEAIKKFKVAQNALAQVAWNFVNDGLRTSLCLQFKPHHIAAGAIFLAAKFLKVKLPSDGEKVWWQEFDVTPRQLEEVSNQMLELYEQNKRPQGSEIEGSSGVAHNQRGPTRTSAVNDEFPPRNGHAPTGAGPVSSSGNPGMSKQSHSCSGDDYEDNYNAKSNIELKPEKDNGSTELSSIITEHKFDGDAKELHAELSHKGQAVEASNDSKAKVDKSLDDRRGHDVIKTESMTEMEKSVDNRRGHDVIKTEFNMEMEKSVDDRRVHYVIKTESKVEMDKSLDNKRVHDVVKTESPEAGELESSVIPKPIGGRRKESGEGPDGQSPKIAVKKFDVNKLKAAVEKKKKSRLDLPRKKDVIDEDDLIERALEDGVELAIKDKRIKQERRESWPKDDSHHDSDSKDHESHGINKGQSSRGTGSTEFVEEGEMLDNPSPKFNDRKRKGSPLDRKHETKHSHEYGTGAGHRRTHNDSQEDGQRSGSGGY